MFSNNLDYAGVVYSARNVECVLDNGFCIDDYNFAKYLTVNGIRYSIDDCVVLCTEDSDLIVGKMFLFFHSIKCSLSSSLWCVNC